VVLAVAGLVWAKYLPYSVKVPAVLADRDLGTSIVTGDAGSAPAVSLSAGWEFARTYFLAVWKALVVGLVLAAAVQVMLPAGWLRRVLSGSGVLGGVRGGLAAVPTLMCSCCAAPLAVGLRRVRVSVSAALAFWLGNPALNPVVLVFALAVLPRPWTVLRLGGGIAVVAAGIAVARWSERRGDEPGPEADAVRDDEEPDARPVPVRFLATLGGMTVRLLPEYAVVVVALGALRGVLFPFGAGATIGLLAVLLLVVAGVLLPVPTGGEIAVVAAILAAGLSPVAAAALLVTLPVLSLPSLLMVRRAFPVPVLLGAAAATAAVGTACAVLVAVAAG
jgi:uncharacterized membrane protein YraQ (UPF0718 family)